HPDRMLVVLDARPTDVLAAYHGDGLHHRLGDDSLRDRVAQWSPRIRGADHSPADRSLACPPELVPRRGAGVRRYGDRGDADAEGRLGAHAALLDRGHPRAGGAVAAQT